MFLNLKAAKALGIAVPLPLLGRADEVIEWDAASSSRCSAARLCGRRGRSSRRCQNPFGIAANAENSLRCIDGPGGAAAFLPLGGGLPTMPT